LHSDDYPKAMGAMRDHLEGKIDVYETIYRIKAKNGKYLKFYDCGQITSKKGKKIVVMGFVLKVVGTETKIKKQMKKFKDLILKGEPSIIELVAKIK
jgi:RNase H-fold protein (predicted Holliday junction resolvase)